jgi:hypothetical protein
VYGQGRETLSPGTFIYISLRYTYICTSAHYNIHDVSESPPCSRSGVRFISSRHRIIFREVSHKKIPSIHRVKTSLNFVTGFPFLPLWHDTIPYQHRATEKKFGHKAHIHASSGIRFHDPSVRVTEDSKHLRARVISHQPTQIHRIQNMSTFRKP